MSVLGLAWVPQQGLGAQALLVAPVVQHGADLAAESLIERVGRPALASELVLARALALA